MARRVDADEQETERRERLEESAKIYSPSRLGTLLANWDRRECKDEEKPPETHSGVPAAVSSENHD